MDESGWSYRILSADFALCIQPTGSDGVSIEHHATQGVIESVTVSSRFIPSVRARRSNVWEEDYQ